MNKIEKVDIALAEAVKLAVSAGKNGKAKTADGKSLADKLREAAKANHEAGLPAKYLHTQFYAAALGQGIPKGTAGNYAKALRGYAEMLAQNRSIDTGGGAEGNKPLPVPVAVKVAERADMDEAARAEADALAERMDEAKDYAARIREAAKTAARWEAFCILLPIDKLEPVPEKGGAAKTLSEADKAAMEAAAERAALLAALDGDTDEAEDGEAAEAPARKVA